MSRDLLAAVELCIDALSADHVNWTRQHGEASEALQALRVHLRPPPRVVRDPLVERLDAVDAEIEAIRREWQQRKQWVA